METSSDKQTSQLEAQISPKYKVERTVKWISHSIVLLLSMALIGWISYDTFEDVPFLQNHAYMRFQLFVCIVFIADFFIELSMSRFKWSYVRYHWFYLLISIPYLNIINIFDIDFTQNTLYYMRFIPLIRGAYSLAMVVGYFSSNRAMSLLASYAAILLSIIYFASLIFYQQEKSINSDVTDYWLALWWACMNVTTIGCYINPLSVAGKVCGVVLAGMGMLMLPLFTVFITAKVKDYNERRRQQYEQLMATLKDKTSTASDKYDSSDLSDK